MPLNSFLSANTPGTEQVYVSILEYLNPKSFLEVVQLAHFFSEENKQSKDESKVLARSLDEIRNADNDVFTQEDTVLTTKAQRMIGGLTNLSYKVITAKNWLFMRIPGPGSEQHVSRIVEAHNLKLVRSLGLNIQIFFINEKTGLYIGEFIKDARPLTEELLQQKQTMFDIARVLKKLHTSTVLFLNNYDNFTRLKDLLDKIDAYGHTLLHDRTILDERLQALHSICEQDQSELVPCHNDPTALNFLYKGEELYLLDYEYASNSHGLSDLANFALTSKLSPQCEQWLLQAYYNQAPSETIMQCFEAYKHLTSIWYYLWAELQLANKSNVNPREELVSLAHEYWDKFGADKLQKNYAEISELVSLETALRDDFWKKGTRFTLFKNETGVESSTSASRTLCASTNQL